MSPSTSVVGGSSGVAEITLDPYVPTWTTVHRRRPNRRKSRRELQTLLNLDELFSQHRNFIKYYNIRFPGIIIDRDINIFKTDKDLLSQVGKLSKIIKSNRNTLLVEASSIGQADKVKALTSLDGNVVTVEPHRSFNGSKGVVRSQTFSQSSEDELRDCLKEQGVSDVRRVKIKRDGALLDTHTYIVSFTSSTCPRVLKVTSWHYERVEEYVYRPQQCFKCQNYGHVAKFCRQETDRCANCGQLGHIKSSCNNDVCCYHCKEQHPSYSRSCKKYTCESAILDLQMKGKIPRLEAMDKILAKYPEYERLYAQNSPDPPSVSSQDDPPPTPSDSMTPAPTLSDSPTPAPSGSTTPSQPSPGMSRTASLRCPADVGGPSGALPACRVSPTPPVSSTTQPSTTAAASRPKTTSSRPKPSSSSTTPSYSSVTARPKTSASLTSPQKGAKRKSPLVPHYDSASDDIDPSPSRDSSQPRKRSTYSTKTKSGPPSQRSSSALSANRISGPPRFDRIPVLGSTPFVKSRDATRQSSVGDLPRRPSNQHNSSFS